MEPEPNFTWRELAIILLLALAGSAIDYWLIKKISIDIMIWSQKQIASWGPIGLLQNAVALDLKWWGLSQPTSKIVLFGGLIFVLWICLGYHIIGKKYSALVTSVFVGSVSWIVNPGHSIVEMDFIILGHVVNIMRFAGIFIMGVIIELTIRRKFWFAIIGGGLANLACVEISWLAFGSNTLLLDKVLLAIVKGAPFVIPYAVISGAAGVLLSYGVLPLIRKARQVKKWHYMT
jgi:hypothetical protein